MAKILPIDSEPHFSEYAELLHLESWDEKVTRRMKEDRDAKWQFRIALICGAMWLVWYVAPMIARMMQ